MKIKLSLRKKGRKNKISRFKTSGKILESAPKMWNILLVAFVSLNVLIMVLSLYLFLKIGEDEVFVDDGPSGVDRESIERADLERAIGEIELRRQEFERISEEGFNIIDPS